MKKLSSLMSEALRPLDSSGKYGDFSVKHPFSQKEGIDIETQVYSDIVLFLEEYFKIRTGGMIEDKISELADDVVYYLKQKEGNSNG